jgi:type II secretory ATPase GspE/PulE/Tfp pilus assembly ATPase PilB-like protein
LCKCRAKRPMSQEMSRRMIKDGIAEPPKNMYVATGCADCNQTGYRGRVGVYELLVMNDTLR